MDEECKPGGSAYRLRSDLWHNTKQGNMTLDDFYNKIERLWFVQFQLWGAQSISQRCLPVQSEQSRHYTVSDWAAVKRRCQSLKLQPSAYKELSKDNQTKQGNRTVSVHQYKHWCKCFCQLTSPSENTSDSKEVSKAKRQPKMQPGQTSSSSHHNPTKRVVHHGKTTRASKTSSLKVIAHNVVISSTKTTSDAQWADINVRYVQR